MLEEQPTLHFWRTRTLLERARENFDFDSRNWNGEQILLFDQTWLTYEVILNYLIMPQIISKCYLR